MTHISYTGFRSKVRSRILGLCNFVSRIKASNECKAIISSKMIGPGNKLWVLKCRRLEVTRLIFIINHNSCPAEEKQLRLCFSMSSYQQRGQKESPSCLLTLT